jgi:SAM-dependent methyltransferase
MTCNAVESPDQGAALIQYVACNLCGSDDSDVVYRRGAFNIVKCRSCGLTYVNPRLGPPALAKEYDEAYYHGGSYDDYMGEVRGFEETFEKRLEKIERLVRPGRILDVGCAFGFFLSVARRRGWDAYGVDLSLSAARYARDELGLPVIHGTLAQANFGDDYFDAAIMNDVFEHFTDPLAELAQAYRVLKTGGYLFIVTQDINSLIVRVLGPRWAQYKPREHLYYFTRATLRAMLEKAGFNVLRIESEGLVCTFKFLVGKLRNLNVALGRLAEYFVRKLGVQGVLVPLRPGYEIMAYARKE